MEPNKQQINIFKYAIAWVAYLGAFLTKASKLGDVIRDSFSDIHVPKKEDFLT